MPDAIVTTHPDKDGVTVTESRLRKQKTSVTTSETVTGGLWKKVQYVEPDTGLVGWELTTTRSVTGVAIVSTRLDPDGTVITREETFSELSAITASEVLVGSNVVKTFAEAISDLVGWKVVETKPVFANKSSTTEINDPVPDEFKGVIPSYETETTVTGAIVDPPVLSAGDLKKTEEQISTLLKRVILLTRAGISFPVVFANQELTTQYGGGLLDVTLTLNNSALTADEGFRVVRSKVIVTGGGSLWLKETAALPDDEDWPELASSLWDEEMRVQYDETRQTVDPSTSPSVAGGGDWAFVSEVKAEDKWHSVLINTNKPQPAYLSEATALVTYAYRPYRFPGRLTEINTGALTPFDAYIAARSGIVRHTIKTWWEKSSSPPTLPSAIDIIPDTVQLVSGTYGDVIHNLVANAVTGAIYGPTTPTLTEYTGFLGTYQLDGDITLTNGSEFFTTTGSTLSLYDQIGVSWGAYEIIDLSPLTLANPWIGPSGTITTPLMSNYSSTRLIGNDMIISATCVPAREKDIWKCQTESVIAR